ncbi:DUF305 domain-containing protein [Frankia sp. AgB32]|uniref:DUF305 domain-containing protein n=1 Tax=Frankia sp. AgB32 TaxID=631119 RepID=UPI00200EA423|nr:DUF305 domain-containing protein [Frankia sp. AgB32]MCK9893149.1 DUF305 domain-containing protein [Frankia sp. AgB32]
MSESDPRAGGGLPAATAPADAPASPRGGMPGNLPISDNRPRGADERPTGGGDLPLGGADRPGRGRRRSALLWTPVLLVLVAGLLAAGAALHDLTASSPGEDSVDVGFARDMSEHHAQAVQVAMIEFDRGADPTSRSVAQDVALTQQREIGIMSAWLSGWGRTQTASGAPMRWMGVGGAGGAAGASDGMASMPGMDMGGASATASPSTSPDDTARMPGMATPAQLRRLASSSGHDLDVQFLTLMIHHHRGGLAMAQYAAEHGQQDRTRDLARAMVLNQSIEIEQMQQDLVRLGAPRA